jgi:CII-binding regulator of phage lambda lysogenization HflD
MTEKYNHLLELSKTVAVMKENQQKAAKKIAEVSNNYRSFKELVKKNFTEKYDTVISELQTRMINLEGNRAILENKKRSLPNSKPYQNSEKPSSLKSGAEYDMESVFQDSENTPALENFDEQQIRQIQGKFLMKSSSFKSNDFQSGIDKEQVAAEVEKGIEEFESKITQIIEEKQKETIELNNKSTDALIGKLEEFKKAQEEHKSQFSEINLTISQIQENLEHKNQEIKSFRNEIDAFYKRRKREK